jgi:hypothetical protein
VVARTVIDLSFSSSEDLHDTSLVYNLTNPLTFHWTQDLLPALSAAGLSFKTVPQREWIQLLRDSNPDPVKNPTRKLLGFFEEKYDNDNIGEKGRKGLVFETQRTEEASEILKGGWDVIQSGLVGKMVKQWLRGW